MLSRHSFLIDPDSQVTLCAMYRLFNRIDVGFFPILNWRKIASLTMSDCVKSFLSVLHRALERERHFSLWEEVPCQPKARSVIVSGQNSIRPMHLFDPSLDHDYYFKLLL